jgi:predicted HNH restriction endonuclease
MLREIDRFGGRREQIVERANEKCECCGKEESKLPGKQRFSIHHRDGNGLNSFSPNHELDNLMLVCRSCHRKIHERMKKAVSA